MVDYYLDNYGTLHVLLNGVEIGSETNCNGLTEQGLHDVAYEILEEYGYLTDD